MNPSAHTSYLARMTTSELICLPFLDTDTTELESEADRLLHERGWSPAMVRRWRRVARAGLWWQLVAWEWAHLDVSDVVAGYGAIVLAVAAFLVLAGISLFRPLLSLGIIAAGVGLALLAGAVAGWWLHGRRGGIAGPE